MEEAEVISSGIAILDGEGKTRRPAGAVSGNMGKVLFTAAQQWQRRLTSQAATLI